MRTYKLFIQEYNIMENDYITREEIVKTNDIYQEIGKIYCQSLVKIKRIDYLEITKDLEQEIERLHSIIKEVRELVEQKIKGYMEVIDMLKTSSVETKKEEIIELKYRIREQEEFLEILDKERNNE